MNDINEESIGTGGIARRTLLRAGGIGGLAAFAVPVLGTATAGPARAQGSAATAAVFDPASFGKVHRLDCTEDTVRVGMMDPAATPVLKIQSGDVVHYPDTWVNWANEATYKMATEVREKIPKRYPNGPTSLIGPVNIRGAEPGDVIECRMVRVKPRDWGWNSAVPGMGALPERFSDAYLHYFRFDEERKFAEFLPGMKIPLNPTQGFLAAQPAGADPVSALYAGAYGGCVEIPQLVEGTALYIQVQQPGGRIWTGDSQAAQGDGVVNQTAIETGMEDLRIQYVLHKQVRIASPIVQTPTHWIIAGYGETVDDAITTTLESAITWLSPALQVTEMDVFSILSTASSLRVTQYARQSGKRYKYKTAKAIHILVPKAVFDEERQAMILKSLSGKA